MILKTFFPSCLTPRPSAKIRRALSDRQIRPFDKGRIQFRGILGIAQRPFESPCGTPYGSSINLDNMIIPAGFCDLAIKTRWSKDPADNFRIKSKSVRGDQRCTFQI
jgi:hypothetical protein